MSRQKDLFDQPPYRLPEPAKEKAFDGPEYQPARDHKRLAGQVLRVFNAMKDGEWRTLDQIEKLTGDPVASISAQLRHLRKTKYGSHDVQRRHVGSGLFQYRVIVNG